jgi:hypothetical protein
MYRTARGINNEEAGHPVYMQAAELIGCDVENFSISLWKILQKQTE